MKNDKKNLEICIYEGKLPETIAKDFEYSKVYEAYGKGVGGGCYSKRDKVPNEEIISARNFALSDAVHHLMLLVKRDIKKNPGLSIELLADLNVTREQSCIDERRGNGSPLVYITVQAIGYKRKPKDAGSLENPWRHLYEGGL